MENEGNATGSQQKTSTVDQGTPQPQQSVPPKPKWKPNTYRRRKRTTTKKVIPPAVKKAKQEGDTGVKRTSWVWDHFTSYKDENEDFKASCDYCGQVYAAHPSLHGTGNLINHLQLLCKKYPYGLADDKQKKLVFESKDGCSLRMVTYSYEESRGKLVEMIIIDELPFTIVEGEGFKRFVVSLQPKFTPPGRMTIARDVMELYGKEMIKLKKLIKSERIFLTTDTWTSIQNINYMCLTTHWIDKDWRLQKRILSFSVIPNHKGATISKMIETTLLAWGIDKILTVTVDNASSNDGALKNLKKNTKGWKTTILDHEFLHMRCSAHILNLIVKDGLKNENDSIVRIRNAIRYVRSSPGRLKAFKTFVDIEKIESKSLLCLDIETRWNSTYLMLKTAVKFEKAFERLKKEDGNYQAYFALGEKDNEEGDESLETASNDKGKGKAIHLGPLNEYDWSVAKSFIKFLKLFYDVTKKISGSLSVTSNRFFQEIINIQSALKKLSVQGDPNVCIMAMNMKKKFTKYWESLDKLNFLLYVAAVLDPRHKMRFVEFCLTQVYHNDITSARSMEDKVRSLLVRLYEYYQRHSTCQSNQVASSSSNQASNDNDVVKMDENEDICMSIASQFAKQLEDEENGLTKNELTKYLEESCEKSVESFDILRWWKDNSGRFPVLSQLAREVLAIPVSTVASESAFSTSGRILDPYRSSRNPEMVEALVCCQNWLRSTPTTIDIQEFMKGVSMEDIENIAEVIREYRNPSASNATNANATNANLLIHVS